MLNDLNKPLSIAIGVNVCQTDTEFLHKTTVTLSSHFYKNRLSI